MAIPLYQQESWRQRLDQAAANTAHPGLLFDKFIREWSDSWGKLGTDAKQKFFKRIIDHAGNVSANIETGLQNAHQQQKELVEYLGGSHDEFQTVWRFVSGLGAAHPFESGFIWHRTLGVPYLPGSSIKGMMRAWTTRWLCGEEDADEEQIRRRVERLFGPENVTDQGGDCGAFIAFDALPVAPPELELDILNPHYQPYYEDPALPPADYYSPVPVFFLTVAPGQRFSFALAPRRGAKLDDKDLEWLWSLLVGALGEMGAGGKTAVGYGGFKKNLTPQSPPPEVGADETAVWLKHLGDPELIFVSTDEREHRRKISDCQFKPRYLKEGLWYVLRGTRAVHLKNRGGHG